jgi:hypothetical protein
MIAIPFFVAAWICAYLAVYAVDDLEAYYRLGVAAVVFMVLGWAALMVDLVWSRSRRSQSWTTPPGVSGVGSGFSRHREGGPPGSTHQTLTSGARTGPRSGGAAGPSSYETWPYRIGDLP